MATIMTIRMTRKIINEGNDDDDSVELLRSVQH